MRTAVVRVCVDPAGELTAEQLTAGMADLAQLAAGMDAQLIETSLVGLPAKRREVQILMTGADPVHLQSLGVELCAKAFPTQPVAGVLTFASHGTDDDARGVLAGFGVVGVIDRTSGDEGWDVITVTLRKADLTRIPESRIHTALEASTNCEIHIVVVDEVVD